MELDSVTPAAMLTITGASIVLSVVMGAIIAAWHPTAEQKDRFGPLLALIVGVVLVGGFAVVQGADIAAAFLVGILAGGGSMAVHDVSGALGGP